MGGTLKGIPSPWRAIAKVQAAKVICTLAVGDSNPIKLLVKNMNILFERQVCWQDREDYAPYQPTYLNLVVFDRGNGPEVIRTCFANWQERVEKGEARVAKVPSKYLENLQQLVYARKELQPLIG